ncbi:hypothetical protein [Salipaludibacillus agaradhaerens]|uniref:hypothetical protein n=1 Tax=Salipaludibacillus agaradhaerens TaxID=76935 RepID=UPI00099786F7|nr:hypothetical protein [Salipaludibacillus agaradhaerens]
MNQIENTVIQLLSLLKQYNNGQIYHQIDILKEILDVINSNESDESKKERVKGLIDNLYPVRGGLTDFHIWNEDEKERIKVNKSLSELNDKLWYLSKN